MSQGGAQCLWDQAAGHGHLEMGGQDWRGGLETEFTLLRLDKIALWGLYVGVGRQDLDASE